MSAVAAGQPFALCAIVASIGGLSAISTVLSGLTPALPLAIAVVIHRAKPSTDDLRDLLGHRTSLRVHSTQEGDTIRNGWVYLAPGGVHLVVKPEGVFGLSTGPPVRYVRPAGDVLFSTAAAVFRDRLIAAVLTGGDGDGADGVVEVKSKGGTTIAQREDEAEAPGMPGKAIASGAIDHILLLREIGPAIQRLAGGSRTVAHSR